MTPKQLIFQSVGLFVDGIPNPGGTAVTHDPLERLTRDQLIRMAQALQIENSNLRDGIQAGQETIDELQEAYTNQRQYIQELEAESLRLVALLDQAAEALAK